MARLKVQSREYKVMLLPERLDGSEGEMRAAIARFWTDVTRVLEPWDNPSKGSFDEVKARRRIRFFDTTANGFSRQRYLFRERVDVQTGERQLTLKYRHPDRYVSSDRNMNARGDRNVETKFEEDVKPPFVSVFSYSTSVEVDEDTRISRVGHVVELFPGLALKDVDDDLELTNVGNFCARELVLVGASLLLGKRDDEAECAMVIWHDDDDITIPPICAEFSFRYGDDDEDYRGSVARDAHDALQVLGTELTEWVHPEPKTKTAFVYG